MKVNSSIVLVTASLGAGGAERVISILANGWVSAGQKVDIVTLEDGFPFYPINSSITIHALGLSGKSVNIFHAVVNNFIRLKNIRFILRRLKPNIVVSFGTETNVLVLLATIVLGIHVVISERCDPHYYPHGTIWKFLRRITYWLSEKLVVQTKAAGHYFDFLSSSRTYIIPNPVQVPTTNDELIKITPPFVLAAGRLTKQKGFDVLLNAFAIKKKELSDWKLVILGEGDQRAALELQIKNLGIREHVLMPGVVTNLGNYMKAAELFVLSSRYEGFPNVLTEAMASGIAVIAADCPSGPSDIVDDGVNGILVAPDNIGALSEVLGRLMGNADLRAKLGNHSASILHIYSIERILSDWEKVFVRNVSIL